MLTSFRPSLIGMFCILFPRLPSFVDCLVTRSAEIQRVDTYVLSPPSLHSQHALEIIFQVCQESSPSSPVLVAGHVWTI